MEVENNIPKGWMETTLEKLRQKLLITEEKHPKNWEEIGI